MNRPDVNSFDLLVEREYFLCSRDARIKSGLFPRVDERKQYGCNDLLLCVTPGIRRDRYIEAGILFMAK